MATSNEPRPQRLCDLCYQVDDHPRHVINGPGQGGPVDNDRIPDGTPASAIAELLNPNSSVRHLDCCAEAGCPICQATEQVTGGARGAKLIKAIVDDGVLADFDPSTVPGAEMVGA